MCELRKWGALAVFVFSGCIPTLVENPSREVSRAVPKSFGAEEGKAEDNVAQQHWKTFFAQPELQDLIALALKNNQELNVRIQEMVIANAEVSARRGEYLPKLKAGLDVGVEKVGKYTSQGASDEANGVPEHLGNFSFGLAASWEIDVWGKLRSAANAADARSMATIEARNFMVTQLVAELARSYFELIAVDNELEVLKRNIVIQADALEVVKLEKQAARVTQLAVQRFEAEVLKNRSRRFDLEQERVMLENRINFLVGRYPQPVARRASELKDPLPAVLKGGLPSQLLENRPDIRQAEMEMKAAELDVASARAAFFPALSIDAAIGYRSFNIAHLVATPESILYNLAGNLMAPLLNRAGIEAQYRTANAKQLQAVFNYERTLLQAYTDVVNQLVKFENLQKGYALQEQQVHMLAQSVEVSNVLFQAARADYMEVLLTRRDSLDAELELIETRKRLMLAMVSLYQALGGGWRAG